MRFSIPDYFELGGRKIVVKYVKQCSNCEDHVDGQAVYAKGLIELKETTKVNKDYRDFVFFHELVHHIFNHTAYDKLAKDEALVDRFASALYQAIKTME
jgi:hypothetical protein